MGIAAYFVWLQADEFFLLSQDALACNNGLLIALVFACALPLSACAHRRLIKNSGEDGGGDSERAEESKSAEARDPSGFALRMTKSICSERSEESKREPSPSCHSERSEESKREPSPSCHSERSEESKREPQWRALVVFSSAVSVLCFLLYGLIDADAARTVCLCVAMASAAPLTLAWGLELVGLEGTREFSAEKTRSVVSLVCCAAIVSVLVLAFIFVGSDAFRWNLLTSRLQAGILFMVCIAVSQVAWVAAGGGHFYETFFKNLMKHESCNTHEPYAPSAAGAQARVVSSARVSFLILLGALLLETSLFSGFATVPYYANSIPLAAGSVVFELVYLFVITGGRALTASRSRETFVLVAVFVLLVTTVAGFLMIVVSYPHTLMVALGMLAGAEPCLVALAWIALPPLALFLYTHGIRIRSSMRYALLSCAGFLLFGRYAGAWIACVTGIDFGALTTIAVLCIALLALAVFVILGFIPRWREGLGASVDERGVSADAMASVVVDSSAVAPSLESGEGEETTQNSWSSLVDIRRDMLEPYPLTEREFEVAMLLLDGQTMAGIAEKLFITERTVKFHSKNVYEKLGVANKRELLQKFSGGYNPPREILVPSEKH